MYTPTVLYIHVLFCIKAIVIKTLIWQMKEGFKNDKLMLKKVCSIHQNSYGASPMIAEEKHPLKHSCIQGI